MVLYEGCSVVFENFRHEGLGFKVFWDWHFRCILRWSRLERFGLEALGMLRVAWR